MILNDVIQNNVSKDLRKEEECLREAEEASQQVTTAKAKLIEMEASKEAEEKKLEEILEGLEGATQGLRDNLEVAQSQLADAERATASIQVRSCARVFVHMHALYCIALMPARFMVSRIHHVLNMTDIHNACCLMTDRKRKC